MKNLLVLATVLGLVITPLLVFAQSDQAGPITQQAARKGPPVAQELVAEGEFAMKLAADLKLGTPASEAQAEDMLLTAGISPKNGWIANYPMTPIIIGQVRNAIEDAAASKKILMGKDEALKTFDGVTAELGLAVRPAPDQYAEGQLPPDSENVPPPDIENYYYAEGPPVITYYPPPWDYDYLYGWVPYPFWYAGFFFPGFYILNDFHCHHHNHHHHHDHLISNHHVDRKTNAFVRVDPTTRSAGTPATRTPDVKGFSGLGSRQARLGAASIWNRSVTGRSWGQPGMAGRQYGGFRSPSTGYGRSFGAPSTGGHGSYGGSHGGGHSGGSSGGSSLGGTQGGGVWGGRGGGR